MPVRMYPHRLAATPEAPILPQHDGSPGRALGVWPPPEIGAPLSVTGLTESEATSSGRTGTVILALFLGGLVGAGAMFGLQYLLSRGIRGGGPLSNDWVYESAVIGTVLGLASIAVTIARGFTKSYPAPSRWVGRDGIAELGVLGGQIVQKRVLRFEDTVDVRLALRRHGKNGISLRKTWSFVGRSGTPIHEIVGEGTMNAWSADPARATARDDVWSYGEAAVAAYTRFRASRGR